MKSGVVILCYMFYVIWQNQVNVKIKFYSPIFGFIRYGKLHSLVQNFTINVLAVPGYMFYVIC